MATTFTPFQYLTPGVHALLDASTARELGESRFLRYKLTPTDARETLRQFEQFGVPPALTSLERSVVTEILVVDLIAVDSLDEGRIIKSFNYHPSSSEFRNSGFSTIDAATAHALETHVRSALSSPFPESDLQRLLSLTGTLELSFTLIPREIYRRCIPLLERTVDAIGNTHRPVRWDTFAGADKPYWEALKELFYEVAFLARSNSGAARTVLYYEVAATVGLPVILHPDRDDEVQAICSACSDAYSLVNKTIQSTFDVTLRDRLVHRPRNPIRDLSAT